MSRFAERQQGEHAVPFGSMKQSARDMDVTDLMEPGRLRSALLLALGKGTGADVAVALSCRSGSAWAGLSNGDADEGRCAPLPIGCIAKLLTASLARRAFALGLLRPDDDVGAFLRTGVEGGALRAITLRRLLEHTHGVDDSRLERIHFDRRGFVDVASVMQCAGTAPIAMPGVVYSYGSLGPALVAAVLEARTQERYGRLLQAVLLAPLGMTSCIRLGNDVCPATGGALMLGARDLTRVLEGAALTDGEAWPGDDRPGTFGAITPLPGWNPLERGIHLGFKYCGRDWFGHQSAWPAASIFVRVNPKRGIVVVVTSRGEYPAALAAARLVGSVFPELFDMRMPVRTSVDLDSCAGTYASAAWTVDICSMHGELEISVRRYSDRSAFGSRAPLRSTPGGLFFPQGACANSFPYVQFVSAEGVAYLWNGRFLLRRRR